MLKLNASYSKKVPAGEEYSNFRTGSLRISCRLGFMKRSTSYGIRLKQNCTETIPVITALILLQMGRKTHLKAGGQETVRTTVRQVRNSFRICLILLVSVA